MKEEPKFFAIDAAIEIAENPKYEQALMIEEHQLRRFKEAGNVKIKRNKVVKETPPYQRWTNLESTIEDKETYRTQAIESLKISTEALMNSRIPSESNLEKLQKNISSLEHLQNRGIIASDDESVETIKARATKHLDENPKGDFEGEIDEILGDPIEEIEIPIEEVEMPEEDMPEEDMPEEEGKK